MYVHAPQLSAQWQPLGGRLLAAPAVVSPPSKAAGSYPTPLFIAVARDHALYLRGLGTPWRKLASAHCLDNPAAAVIRTTLYVACQGADHALWYGTAKLPRVGLPRLKSLNSLGGKLSAGPAIASLAGRPTFFVSGRDHRLYTRTPSRGYLRFSLPCYGHPAANAAPDGSVTYAACEGERGTLYVVTTNGNRWSATTSYGGSFTGGPGVAATNAGAVFWATARRGSLMVTTTPNGWSDAGIGLVHAGAQADGIG
jgi:hypothetical protein